MAPFFSPVRSRISPGESLSPSCFYTHSEQALLAWVQDEVRGLGAAIWVSSFAVACSRKGRSRPDSTDRFS